MSWEALGIFVVGWLLGLLSPGIVSSNQRRGRRKELLVAIGGEFHELRYKMVLVAHRVRAKFGTFDQASYEKLSPILLSYVGLETDKGLTDSYRKLADRGAAEFVKVHQTPETPVRSLYPAKYQLPMLDAVVGELADFKPATLARLLRVRAELDLFNDQVTQVHDLHHKTFDASLSPANHDVVRGNLAQASKKLGERAEILIENINGILESDGTLLVRAR